MDTVTLTIDGKTVQVRKGWTILEAAIEHGIEVPFYCYHPGLGVDGSCRVCIVKVEKMPKPQVACATTCTEGMVVHTQSPDIVAARQSVFEFLLINHPLDCPVCDKGGECPLQDYTFDFGSPESRTEFPRRVFDGEGAAADVNFGPTLMLNRNRCILCTRCIRFMKQVDGDAQIGVADRGYGSELATFDEAGVHSLLSGNLIDVCPVGAITSKDYRFASRPWDNNRAIDTICTQCSKGCNTMVWVKSKPEWAKGSRIVKITPRYNPDVNDFWMCDIGRWQYHWAESDRRLRKPLLKGSGGAQQPATWHDALRTIADRVGAVKSKGALRVLASAHASLEELYALKALAAAIDPSAGALHVSWSTSEKAQPKDTLFSVPSIDAPNVDGARALGVAGQGVHADLSALQQAVAAGSVAALYVCDPGPEGSLGDVSWIVGAKSKGLLPVLIVQGPTSTSLTTAADVVLPGGSSFEKSGCYTNDKGLVQATAKSIPLPGEAHDDFSIVLDVARALGAVAPFTSIADVHAAIAAALPGNAAYANLAVLAAAGAADQGSMLQSSNPVERRKWEALYSSPNKRKGAVDPVAVQTAIWMRKAE